MSPQPEDIAHQVLGSINALNKLTVKERDKKPSTHYASDYNRLLNLARQSLPDIAGNRWPADIPIKQAPMGPMHSQVNYIEILSYLNQITAIFEQNIEHEEVYESFG